MSFDEARDQLAAAKSAGVEPPSKMQRAMLIALAQHPSGLSRKQVLIFTGYARSGTVNAAFARLLVDELIASRDGLLLITTRGMTVLGEFEPLPTGTALREKLLNGGNELSTMEKEILRNACNVYPDAIDRNAARGAYARSGTVNAAFARLIAMSYLRKSSRGGIAAAPELFS